MALPIWPTSQPTFHLHGSCTAQWCDKRKGLGNDSLIASDGQRGVVRCHQATDRTLFRTDSYERPRGGIAEGGRPDMADHRMPGLRRSLRLTGSEAAAASRALALIFGDAPDESAEEEEEAGTAGAAEEAGADDDEADEYVLEADDASSEATDVALDEAEAEAAAEAEEEEAKVWAVENAADVASFAACVPHPAISYPFELDAFQKRAVLHLERREDVFVSAHTSSGKTVVAEYAIALALRQRARAVYTSPVKALSNQKFRELRGRFGEGAVGLLTGDASINPSAPCLIVTTEILRGMLQRRAAEVAEMAWVIFDEVHYINDIERGVVWEESIISLPPSCRIVCLSATVPNSLECAQWIGATKRRVVHVVSTSRRPTPLRHYIYAAERLYPIIDEEGCFLPASHAQAALALKEHATQQQRGGGKGAQSGKGKGAGRGGGGRGGGGGGYWWRLLGMLRQDDLLPAVVFSFSKVKCDELASSIASSLPEGASLSSSAEVDAACEMYEKGLERLSAAERGLPQLVRVRELLRCGLGVHHSGMLPIVREVTELLFSRGLVKVVLATETFAVGVNMPARCVVFNGVRKNDGRGFRELLPGEYTQMSGRAGRRGIDAHGVCIIAGDELTDVEKLRNVMVGTPPGLGSRFGITYSMLLTLARSGQMRCSALVRSSFLAHRTRSASRRLTTAAAELALELDAVPPPELSADGCTPEQLAEYVDLVDELCAILPVQLALAAHLQAKGGGATALKRLLPLGRVLLLSGGLTAALGPHPRLAVLLRCDADEATVGGGEEAGSELKPPSLRLRCLLASQQSGALPHALSDVNCAFASSAPPLKGGATAATGVQPHGHGWSNGMRWDVLTVDASLVVELCKPRLSVAKAADALPLVEASLKGVALQLALLQRKHRFVAIETVEPATELQASASAHEDSSPSLSADASFERRIALCAVRALELRSVLSEMPCASSPNLTVLCRGERRRRWVLARIDELSHAAASGRDIVTLLPDAARRVELLLKLGYLEAVRGVRSSDTPLEGTRLTLKGRVACELTTAFDELLLTEAVCTGSLHGLSAPEVAGVLSLFVSKGKLPQRPPRLPAALQRSRDSLYELAKRTTLLQAEAGVLDLGEEGVSGHVRFALNDAMIAAAHAWASGAPFSELSEHTVLHEGDVIRILSRVEELAKQVRAAARLLGDAQLVKTLELVLAAIKRELVAAPSLYTDAVGEGP